MQYLDELNDKQREAVESTDGPLLVVAGAGTGKTKTLTHRIVHLIHEGVHPGSILALTFTNKAAGEMSERVQSLIAQYLPHTDLADRPFMSTFHALGVFLLRRHAETFKRTRGFTILDQTDSLSLLKRALAYHDLSPKEWEPKKIRKIIGMSKAKCITREAFTSSVHSPMTEVTAMVWQKYEEMKQRDNAFDFDDLVYEVYRLLDRNKEIREHYQKRWTHIHIDEYQDTNTVQYKLIKLLVGPNHNICAVGDGDQTIYTWRGATLRNILQFERDYPDARVVILEQNYRSTDTILEASHEIIRHNKARIDKKLFTQKKGGQTITQFTGLNGSDEAYYIARTCKDLIRGGKEPRDIAVLFRTNFQSRILEEAFLSEDIPYHVVGVRFFQRKEIKDILAYIRASMNPDSRTDIARIINEPKRGIGKTSLLHILAGDLGSLRTRAREQYDLFRGLLSKIRDFGMTNKPSLLISYILEISGIKAELERGGDDDLERLENIKELVTYATRYDRLENGLEAFLEQVALLGDQDDLASKEGRRNAVRLMTVHAAKGLEFDTVFVTGLEQGLFPSDHGGEKKEDTEEERRLCYVAITRAKTKLYVTHAHTRRIYGREQFQAPSEFLHDIPDHLVEHEESRGNANIPTIYLDF